MKIVFLAILVCGTLFYSATVLFPIRHNEELGAWTIVRQRDRTNNFGYVTELGKGFVNAGFTNKAEAIKAMKEARWHYRHPPKPEKEKPFWEPQ